MHIDRVEYDLGLGRIVSDSAPVILAEHALAKRTAADSAADDLHHGHRCRAHFRVLRAPFWLHRPRRNEVQPRYACPCVHNCTSRADAPSRWVVSVGLPCITGDALTMQRSTTHLDVWRTRLVHLSVHCCISSPNATVQTVSMVNRVTLRVPYTMYLT